MNGMECRLWNVSWHTHSQRIQSCVCPSGLCREWKTIALCAGGVCDGQAENIDSVYFLSNGNIQSLSPYNFSSSLFFHILYLLLYQINRVERERERERVSWRTTTIAPAAAASPHRRKTVSCQINYIFVYARCTTAILPCAEQTNETDIISDIFEVSLCVRYPWSYLVERNF